jgi:hypothetical protein
MFADEYAEQRPAISYDEAYRFTGHHLAAPGVELASAIAQGDVIVIDRKGQPYEPLHAADQIDTASFLAWLGY